MGGTRASFYCAACEQLLSLVRRVSTKPEVDLTFDREYDAWPWPIMADGGGARDTGVNPACRWTSSAPSAGTWTARRSLARRPWPRSRTSGRWFRGRCSRRWLAGFRTAPCTRCCRRDAWTGIVRGGIDRSRRECQTTLDTKTPNITQTTWLLTKAGNFGNARYLNLI